MSSTPSAVVIEPQTPQSTQVAQALQNRAYIPMVIRGPSSQTAPPTPSAPPTDPNDYAGFVNYYRTAAGVPPVTFDATLNNNCWLHSRYMAEENIIAHDEKRDSKWFSAGGLSCAQNGYVWLGGDYVQPYWKARDAVQGWAASVGHRMWLLYPTTPVFGFGFYAAANNRAGSSLDVLTQFNSAKDAGYANWPVRFPGSGQTGVPATPYPITLGWSYFGSTPTVGSVSLTANGKALANTVTTTLPVGHKGIQITPSQALPANTIINITVSGTYDGKAFSYSWSFTTGS